MMDVVKREVPTHLHVLFVIKTPISCLLHLIVEEFVSLAEFGRRLKE